MGTDAMEEMGTSVKQGNNRNINLEPDKKEDADRLCHALADGCIILQSMQEMIRRAYFGQLQDRLGVCWMINFTINSVS